MELTKEELDAIHTWLNEAGVGNLQVERPVVPAVRQLDRGGVGVVMGGKSELSPFSQKKLQRRIADKKKHAKAKARRAEKVKRGRFHPKKKEATRRRAALKRWYEQPYKSVVYGFGNWSITQEEWDLRIGPLWDMYDAKHLTVKRRWGYGTKLKPYTVYDIDILHKGDVVYRGQDWKIYDSSVPNELDLLLSKEGGQLFEEPIMLTPKRVRDNAYVAKLKAYLKLP